MIGENQIIVYRLGLSDYTDRAVYSFCIPGKFAYSIHRIIAAYIKETADIQLFKFLKQKWIYRIIQIFRKFITAGTKIGSGSSLQLLQIISMEYFLEVQNFS